LIRKNTWLIAASFTALVAGGEAHADASASSDDMAPIIVSGSRYEAPATGTGSKTAVANSDVPAAIVTIPEAVLKDQGARTMNDALANASAVAPNFAGGYGVADNYLIRGLPMRFLRDGLPDGPSFMGYRRSLADIQTLEVLKGPGSALYGRAEAGGSVNLVTRAPLDQWAGEVAASYGSRDSWSATGDVGGPLSDGVSTRLIANHEEGDSYRGLERRMTEILPTVALALGDRNTLTIDYDYRDSEVVVDNFGIPFTIDRKLADISRKSRLYSPFNEVSQRVHRITVSDRFEVRPDILLRAAASYDNRKVGVVRNAGSNVVDALGLVSGRSGRTQDDKTEYWTAQAEAVFTPVTGPVRHTLLLGVEYAKTDIETLRTNYALPNLSVVDGEIRASESEIPALATPGFDRSIKSDMLSFYVQEQMDISDVLKIRAGLRHDAVDLEDEGTVAGVAVRNAGTPKLWSWQVGAVYKPVRQVSLYGGYSRGKFVSIQTESTSLTPVPEGSSQVEFGVKSQIIPGQLSANLALFETKRDRYFVTLVPGGNPEPVGKQRSRGVELDVVGTPVKGLSIIGNFAYVKAQNRSAALASVNLIALNQSVYGMRIASTPRASGAVWANYEFQHGPMKGFGLGAGVTYKGATYVDSLELLKVPSYTTFRAALAYRAGDWEARIVANNLTNKRWYSVPTFIGALPGEPRSVQLSLRRRF
jgi:iron complex outermembrane receptor protein